MVNEERDKRRLVEKIQWFANYRYLGVVLLVILGFPAAIWVGALGELYPALLLALAVLLYNSFGLAYIRLKGISSSFKELEVIAFLLLFADNLVITCLIHLSGGIVSPFVFFYLYTVVACGVFFVRIPWVSFLLAGSIAVFYDLLLYLEISKIIALPKSFPVIEVMYKNTAAIAIFAVVVPTAILILSYFWVQSNKMVNRLAESEREQRIELERAKVELEKKVGELEDARRATLHLLRDVDGQRNISQERAEKIRKLYDDLKVVDRMKTEFLAVVSHELRTPLTPIKGYSNMLLSGHLGKVKPKQQKAIGIIKKQGEHLMGLIDTILDVSRMERGKTMELKEEPVSLKGILDDLMDVMEPQFNERKIRIRVNLPKEGFPTIVGDPAKIRHLITKLLSNSLKFTPRGGAVKIVGTKEDDTIKLQIIDDGIGIEKEQLKKVFDKFFQVDGTYTRAAGGVGLGLTIAREIVVAHGGTIWAESEGIGKGAKFVFTLPLV